MRLNIDEWGLIVAIITAGAAAIAVVVTIVQFLVEKARQRREAIVEARRAAVARVLGAVERAARAHALFPISRFWTSGTMELAVELPRLLLELPRADHHVAYWVGRQVQLMQLTTSEKDSLRIATNAGLKLTMWHQGDVATSWFTNEVKREPMLIDAKVPLQNRAKRFVQESALWLKLWGSIVIGAHAIGVGLSAWSPASRTPEGDPTEMRNGPNPPMGFRPFTMS
ncbi:MAG: hypothetical protein ACYC6C_12255 [Coriobacteriia bacterium]